MAKKDINLPTEGSVPAEAARKKFDADLPGANKLVADYGAEYGRMMANRKLGKSADYRKDINLPNQPTKKPAMARSAKMTK
jgi:hypothetical protein